ncbi:ABC transporter ATP-binding protein [Kitasatospora sp. NPDC006697]|uniref:ABC transporter ATP-binding protein n=1 Tax=Kitasatospora sp. NPDC006697 TaxID=3364020 RepID=UPI0036CDDC4D
MSVVAPSFEAERPKNPVLRLEGVSKIYGSGAARKIALDAATLEIHPATVTALVGHSGSGKSTLLNIAGGLEQATSGTVILAGEVLSRLGARQLTALRARAVSYVFQEYNLIRTMTVLENVCLPLELAGTGAKQARQRAGEVLEQVGTAQHRAKFPDQLSGGEQQRVAIARAIADHRPLLLADEPTGALDSANGERVVELLKGIAATGVACVIATHNKDVTRAADRIVQMRDGKITAGAA